jgi:hypothetical protein
MRHARELFLVIQKTGLSAYSSDGRVVDRLSFIGALSVFELTRGRRNPMYLTNLRCESSRANLPGSL